MAQTILDIQKLTKRIGSLILFEDISFSLEEGGKMGIIAHNGAGKTTLLNIICGNEDYDNGKIIFRRDLRIGYLQQQPQYPEELTVMEACFNHGSDIAMLVKGYTEYLNSKNNNEIDKWIERMDAANAWDYEAKMKQILSMLKITEFDKRIGMLSGGELKRVALANILLTEPDLLILDEPTNHLDIEMIEWLEKYLENAPLSLLMVTHDRYFLDRVCSNIIEIDDNTIYSYKGNYSYYLEKRQERIDVTNATITRANNLYRKELDWMRRMPCARGHKARYREDKFYELEKIAKQRYVQQKTRIEMKGTYIGNKIFEADYISKSFGQDKIILNNFFYTFSRYEKMGIVGNNGTGKSTFIKLLLGIERPDNGHISVGETVRFGYYSQEGMTFNQQMKVIDAVRDIAEYVDLGGGKKLSASQFLQHFLFTPETQHNYIYKLSGGEKRRLYLCTVLMQNPNFLILDEPTNDLDIVTLQVLEEYLIDFKGCVIIVSHDRYFMDKVVDHVLVFKGDGNIKDFPGNYSQYRESAKRTPDYSQETKNKSRGTSKIQVGESKKVRLNEKRKLSYKEQKEFEALGKDIDILEKEKKEIEEAFASGTLSVEEITKLSVRLPLLEKELDEKSMRWLELSEINN